METGSTVVGVSEVCSNKPREQKMIKLSLKLIPGTGGGGVAVVEGGEWVDGWMALLSSYRVDYILFSATVEDDYMCIGR